MKNKIPYILLAVAILIGAAIIVKGTNAKKAEKQQNTEYAQSIKDSDTKPDTERLYEFYQTDPESGLAVIYTFRISPEEDGKRSGSITVDGAGKNVMINCAVRREDLTDTFLFSYYGENSDSMGEFGTGDELVRIHKKEKATVPEFIKLPKVYDGEEMVRNY